MMSSRIELSLDFSFPLTGALEPIRWCGEMERLLPTRTRDPFKSKSKPIQIAQLRAGCLILLCPIRGSDAQRPVAFFFLPREFHGRNLKKVATPLRKGGFPLEMAVTFNELKSLP